VVFGSEFFHGWQDYQSAVGSDLRRRCGWLSARDEPDAEP
jgi:hypothetical protein